MTIKEKLLNANLMAILKDNSLKDIAKMFETSENHVASALREQIITKNDELRKKSTTEPIIREDVDTSMSNWEAVKNSDIYKRITGNKEETVGDVKRKQSK